MQNLKSYIEDNKQRFMDELFELIRIKSITGDGHRAEQLQCAEYWKKMILNAGADKCEVFPTEGAPIVFGEKIIDPNKPTVMIYGHYDVMPVGEEDTWKIKPFKPEIRDGKIWARGADDDKGQAFMHAKAFEFMVKTNQLTTNVKFLIEGEEESGSKNLYKFCEEKKEMLKADIILVSDTSMIAAEIPSITTGLRGLCYWQVNVTAANRDLHSGLYGGAVANPINILCKMIAGMLDENNHITIPNFYDDVIELSDYERKLMAEAPFNLDEYKKGLGIKEICGEKGYTTIERVGIRPSFDVCGIWGGFTGEGTMTVIPSTAHAKISTRLVSNQDYHKIGELFKKHFELIAPDCVTVKVEILHGGESYVSPIDLTAYKAAEKALETTYGKKPIPTRSGGSIPIIAGLEKILGIKSILLGFGLGEDAIHSPNESYPVEQFYKGIETIPYFYKYFAEMI